MDKLYHGTRTAFTKGGYLFPVDFHQEQPRPGHKGDDSTSYVYFTPDWDLAKWYALNTPKRRAKPRVLTVEPLGPVEIDPSTYTGEWGKQLRCKAGARVIAVEFIVPDR